jgi:hypothetical protein
MLNEKKRPGESSSCSARIYQQTNRRQLTRHPR